MLPYYITQQQSPLTRKHCGIILPEEKFLYALPFMKEHLPQIHVFPLEGTYLQWWDCRSLGLEEEELEHFMKQEAELFLDEGYMFGEAGSGFERINLACPRDVLEKALKRFLAALQKRGLA